MKKLLWIITALILVGCLPNSLATASVTPQPSLMPVVSEAKTLEVTALPETPTLDIILPSYTPPPTLNVEETLAFLSYLKNRSPCQLPCWGGITPGKSTLNDIQNQLRVFNGVSERTYLSKAGDSWVVGRLDISFSKGNTVININSSYLLPFDGDTVSSINISTFSSSCNRAGYICSNKDYNELLHTYTLPQILLTYGLPTHMFLTADINEAEPTAPDYFMIRLLYPNLGIFVRYTMPVETKIDTYKFCPFESLINLGLIPLGHSQDYQEYFKKIQTDEVWNPSPLSTDVPFYKSTEEAIGITNEVFYRLIMSSPNECFESSINIWPEP